MNHYSWRGTTVTQKLISGTVYAVSKERAHTLLTQKGITPTNISTGLLSSLACWWRNRTIQETDYLPFLDQCTTLLQAGIPLSTILSLCADAEQKKQIRVQLRTVCALVIQGEQLSEALTLATKINRTLVTLIAAGEYAGKLTDVLATVTQRLQERKAFRQTVRASLRLPLLTLLLTLFLLYGLLAYAVPQFQLFFENMNKPLPPQLARLLGLSNSLHHLLSFPVACTLFGSVLLGKRALQRLPTLRLTLDTYLLQLAFVGPLLSLFAMERFFAALCMLHTSGITLNKSITLAHATISNTYLALRLQQLHEKTNKGVSFSKGLESTLSHHLLPDILQIVKAGEQSGTLEHALEKSVGILQRRATQRVDALAQMIQPTLLIFVALCVGLILYAVYIPLFSLVHLR